MVHRNVGDLTSTSDVRSLGSLHSCDLSGSFVWTSASLPDVKSQSRTCYGRLLHTSHVSMCSWRSCITCWDKLCKSPRRTSFRDNWDTHISVPTGTTCGVHFPYSQMFFNLKFVPLNVQRCELIRFIFILFSILTLLASVWNLNLLFASSISNPFALQTNSLLIACIHFTRPKISSTDI
jgi:hypothetical protein